MYVPKFGSYILSFPCSIRISAVLGYFLYFNLNQYLILFRLFRLLCLGLNVFNGIQVVVLKGSRNK